MTNARAARAARAASGAKTAASKAKNNGGTPRSKKPEESPAGLSAASIRRRGKAIRRCSVYSSGGRGWQDQCCSPNFWRRACNRSRYLIEDGV
jgi:hypothetical protein